MPKEVLLDRLIALLHITAMKTCCKIQCKYWL